MSARWMIGTVLTGVLVALGLLAGQGRLPVSGGGNHAGADPVPTEATLRRESTAPPPTTPKPEPTFVTTTTPAIPLSSTAEAPFEPGVLIIGDSVLEGMGILGMTFGPGTEYDTAVSRSILDLPERIENWRNAGPLPHRIVIHLGTNGWLPAADTLLEDVMDDLDGHRVVLVDVAVDRPWTAAANQAIRATAARHDHVDLVDWQHTARPELLRADEVHPNLEGFDVLYRLVADAVGYTPPGPSATVVS